MTARIEAQIERFAPGFRDRVIGRHVMGPAALQAHNANYVGGDIAGGASDWKQLLARPTLARVPWATPDPQLFVCSSSTLPGGGVHGMCGRLAARTVLARLG
jgi:phytoene dehydrogenase-like protein